MLQQETERKKRAREGERERERLNSSPVYRLFKAQCPEDAIFALEIATCRESHKGPV